MRRRNRAGSPLARGGVNVFWARIYFCCRGPTGGQPMKPLLSALVILGVLDLAGAAAAQGQPGQPNPGEAKPGDRSLFIGDAPPALSVARWVRGEPVRHLDEGTIYVIEFWATWCGPC